MVFEETHKLDCESVLESGWLLILEKCKDLFLLNRMHKTN